MKQTRTSLVFILFFLFGCAAFAAPLQVDLFLTTECSHCKAAARYFDTLEKQYPIQVKTYWINQDKAALQLFYQKLHKTGYAYFNVPAYFFCGSHWIGISKALRVQIPQAIEYCLLEQQKGTSPLHIQRTLQHWAEGNMYDLRFIQNLWYPLTAAILALLDALNPCALFYLLNFVAFILLQSSRTNAIWVGTCWLLMLGISHLTETFLPLTTDAFLTLLPIPSFLIGLLYIGVSFTLHRHHKMPLPGMLFASVLGSMAIAFHQETCIPRMNMIFYAHWMAQPSSPQAYLLPFVYMTFYLILPLLILFLSLKLRRYAVRLHPLALSILLVTGALLILAPGTLSSFIFSCITLFVSVVIGWLYKHALK